MRDFSCLFTIFIEFLGNIYAMMEAMEVIILVINILTFCIKTLRIIVWWLEITSGLVLYGSHRTYVLVVSKALKSPDSLVM